MSDVDDVKLMRDALIGIRDDRDSKSYIRLSTDDQLIEDILNKLTKIVEAQGAAIVALQAKVL